MKYVFQFIITYPGNDVDPSARTRRDRIEFARLIPADDARSAIDAARRNAAANVAAVADADPAAGQTRRGRWDVAAQEARRQTDTLQALQAELQRVAAKAPRQTKELTRKLWELKAAAQDELQAVAVAVDEALAPLRDRIDRAMATARLLGPDGGSELGSLIAKYLEVAP